MAQVKEISKTEDLMNNMEAMKDEFAKMLPPSVSIAAFMRTARTAVMLNPDLAEKAPRKSLYVEFSKCAQDGLLPDGREAIIQFFGGKNPSAKYIPMYEGILKRIRNSGELGSIHCDVVRENDTFETWVDEKGPHFKHTKIRGEDRGRITDFYMIAITKDGTPYFEEMTEEDVQVVRSHSRAKDGTAWTDHFSEMGKKTVLRRGSKWLPKSSDFMQVLTRDDDDYDYGKEPEKRPRRDQPGVPAKAAAAVGASGTPLDGDEPPAPNPPGEDPGL